jgi:hypothetical protein
MNSIVRGISQTPIEKGERQTQSKQVRGEQFSAFSLPIRSGLSPGSKGTQWMDDLIHPKKSYLRNRANLHFAVEFSPKIESHLPF